jgi:hypothetical protein
VALDRVPPATPRFNMPFELGLAIAFSQNSKHEWFVFEARAHRLTKSLSDLNGTDPHIHRDRPDGVLRALASALVRQRAAQRYAAQRGLWRPISCGAGDSSGFALGYSLRRAGIR